MDSVPKIDDLQKQVQEDIKSKLGIVTVLGRTFLQPFSIVLAGILKVFYLQAWRVNQNLLPDKCTEAVLRRMGKIFLGRVPNDAVQGEYLVSVTGIAGAVIPVEQVYVNSDGQKYILDSEYTLIGTGDSIVLRALTGGGEGSRVIGDELTSTAPIADVDSSVFVIGETVAPTEAEDISEYRVNVIKYFRQRPQGGARSDFRIWPEGVAGTREFYPYVRQGAPTEVNLYTEALPADSTDEHGTPSQTILDAVRDSIEPEKEPLGIHEIHYLPIYPVAVDVVIENLQDSSLASAIRNSIEAYLYNVRPFIAGADTLDEKNKGLLTYAAIFNIVNGLAIGNFTNVRVYVDLIQVNTYTFEENNIPFLDNLTLE